MTNEDFQQTMLDQCEIATQRHGDIMTALIDVSAQIAAMKTALDAKQAKDTEAMASLTASVDKALTDLAATGAAGHAAVLGTIIAAQKEVQTKISGMDNADKFKALEGKITSAIAAVPVPAAPAPITGSMA